MNPQYRAIQQSSIGDNSLPMTVQMPKAPGYNELAPYNKLAVNQGSKDAIQEQFGFDAPSEFSIEDGNGNAVMQAHEESHFLWRYICPSIRPWNITVKTIAGNKTIGTYDRAVRLPLIPLKCCGFQTVKHNDANGLQIGDTTEVCSVCVPKFHVNAANDDHIYTISQPTCLFGLFVHCFAEGFNCRQPFYLFKKDEQHHVKGNQVGRIVKVWSGCLQEMCSDADNFEIEFPVQESTEGKSRILGSTFLINQVKYESTHSRSSGHRGVHNSMYH
jgi:hypothetical protein